MISSIDYNSDLAFGFKKTDGHSESWLYNSRLNGYCLHLPNSTHRRTYNPSMGEPIGSPFLLIKPDRTCNEPAQ